MNKSINRSSRYDSQGSKQKDAIVKEYLEELDDTQLDMVMQELTAMEVDSDSSEGPLFAVAARKSAKRACAPP